MIKFTINIPPHPQERPRFRNAGNFVQTYDPPKSKEYKKKSEIDEYILACDSGPMTIPGGIFEGKEVLQKLSEGEDIEDLAKFYGTPVKEMQDTLDEYRKFVAAKAKAWQEWKNNSEQTADSEEQESENDGQATLEFETEE
ncbi:hypothetical protein BLH95_09580 [Listeria monocytogenes]|nr:hypothetical protein [Listeria monocytogenes]